MRCTMRGAFVLVLAASATAQAAPPKVEVVQMTVRREPTIEGVRVFGEPGVELQLAVKVAGKPILAVREDSCRLVRFVDDAGTDLAKGAPTGFFHWVKLGNAFRDEPTETCLLDIRTRSLPAKGAGRIEFEAEV
ncbi:MAG: hypothetical protein KAI24_07005, partial [Planctomycetes bacterium]|nr:hypothetical protein [Planctomycetota bacterium]